MTGQIEVRPMTNDEASLWGAMRSKLWPDCGPKDNAEDFAAYVAGGPLKIVFFAFAKGNAIGFAEISERSVVNKCGNAPAAYVEGWYVEPQFQGQGIGGALIRAAADWARQEGYSHLGSDVELDNINSQKAHAALGFEQTGQVVNYVMRLAE